MALPPTPGSLDDIERDSWVLDAHVRVRQWQFATAGLAVGAIIGACGAAVAWRLWRPVSVVAPVLRAATARPRGANPGAEPALPRPVVAPTAGVVTPPSAYPASAVAAMPPFMPPVPIVSPKQQGAVRPHALAIPHPAVRSPAPQVKRTAKPAAPARSSATTPTVLYRASRSSAVTPKVHAAPAASSDRAAASTFQIVSIPLPGLVMVMRDNQVVPVKVGGKLPDGSLLVSADMATGQVRTTRSTYQVK